MLTWPGNCCGCDPATTQICFTITDACTGAAIQGATITVKDSQSNVVGSCTTDATGKCCVGVSKEDTYSATITEPNHCSSTITGISVTTCGTNVNESASLYPTTVSWLFKCTLCGNETLSPFCYPGTNGPNVSVSVTQTSGGTYTGSCTISSSAGCTLTLPNACPGTTNTFTVTMSAPGYVDSTYTITMNGPQCTQGATSGNLESGGNQYWCYPATNCTGPKPATITVVMNLISFYGTCGKATYTGTLNSSGGYTFTAPAPCDTQAPGVGIEWLYDNCGPNAIVAYGGGTVSMSFTSGTVACPVAFTAADNNGNSCTVSQ